MTNNRITLIWDWSSSRLADFIYWHNMSVVGNYKLSVSRGSPQGSNVALHYGCIFWGQNNKVGLSKSTCPSGIPGYEGGIPKLPEPEPLAGRLRKLQCRSCSTDFVCFLKSHSVIECGWKRKNYVHVWATRNMKVCTQGCVLVSNLILLMCYLVISAIPFPVCLSPLYLPTHVKLWLGKHMFMFLLNPFIQAKRI